MIRITTLFAINKLSNSSGGLASDTEQRLSIEIIPLLLIS